MKAVRRFTVRARVPEPLAGLTELATNLRWTWHPETRELFKAMDPELASEVGGDPLRILTGVTPARLDELAADEDFIARTRTASEELHRYLTEPGWYQRLAEQDNDGRPLPRGIAYFSMEFGVTEALPNYSGGLGVLAADHLKSASDLGVPVIGVGLLYRAGYFRQSLSIDGWQIEHYPVIDPSGLPLSRMEDDDGEPVLVDVAMPCGRDLLAQVWQATVGRAPLLLLDTDIEENDEDLRSVTDRLYGGDTDHRIRQELLAGIGGVRAVRRYCALSGHPHPEVFHTNEGHAGFLGVERARELVADAGLSFDEAVSAVRAGTVFTTHTPVPAGIDRFPIEKMRRYFGDGRLVPGIDVERVLELGAEDNPGLFNMAHMGLRLAQRANAVSRLHGAVSRRMFKRLWPGLAEDEIPLRSVTNGVHGPTWTAREMSELLADDDVTDADLWRVRCELRQRLIGEVRRRLRESWLQRGASALELGWTERVFDPEVLTVGFARRVPTYKRLTLMLRDPERLRRILLDERRPVQVVVAGKSHPADEGGKALIQQIVRFADDADVRHRIVFLPDYDMSLARYLYWGCDVWLNNPTRPLEACGTSGMKSALNGGLNLSIKDGWWEYYYDGSNGWAIPAADGIKDPLRRDDLEAAALYELMTQQVAPLFYDRDGGDGGGVPKGWLSMVWHTLATLGPSVQTSRMLREYVERYYLPAAASVAATSADDYHGARELAGYRARLDRAWEHVRVSDSALTGTDGRSELVVGTPVRITAKVELAGLSPDEVDVQAVLGKVGDTEDLHDVVTTSMRREPDGGFAAEVPLPHAGALGYTVRVLPRHNLLASPAELGKVVLQ
ncbi:alpha-glucan family phosphorylase [Haloechinothrix halophila]|uniref:alpha-glucan family phosphorylase n=1 Tax=Haloechinothrix halophila TaxID=1069073 RepID=UPI0004270ABD|nr:alpha-glucan family phosphorylase [Haloechinothrix halophila]